jgi:hypothetical protein
MDINKESVRNKKEYSNLMQKIVKFKIHRITIVNVI